MASRSPRPPAVRKTLKLYIGGAFVRSESGRTLLAAETQGPALSNLPRASRKDARDAVTHARSALQGWSRATPFLRGQILYRMAEMLQGREATFLTLLRGGGASEAAAKAEFEAALDVLISYAGWCDKYDAVFGGTNPVAAPFFNVSSLEPTGVVAVFLPTRWPLLGLAAATGAVLSGGNTGLVVAPPSAGEAALEFAEVLATSDLPGGAWNVLTGLHDELRDPVGGHRDINAFVVFEDRDPATRATLQRLAADSVARVATWPLAETLESAVSGLSNPWRGVELLETKTAWHPAGGR
mgnify:CR=1 FL=1